MEKEIGGSIDVHKDTGFSEQQTDIKTEQGIVTGRTLVLPSKKKNKQNKANSGIIFDISK